MLRRNPYDATESFPLLWLLSQIGTVPWALWEALNLKQCRGEWSSLESVFPGGIHNVNSMMQMMWNVLVYWTRQLTFCVRLVISRPAVMSQDQSLMLLMCGLENLTWTQVESVAVKVSAEGLSQCAVLCLVAQSCLTLCNPMDLACQTPLSMGFRILEWVAMPFSRGASQPRDWT